jgi:hypothetical protein
MTPLLWVVLVVVVAGTAAIMVVLHRRSSGTMRVDDVRQGQGHAESIAYVSRTNVSGGVGGGGGGGAGMGGSL